MPESTIRSRPTIPKTSISIPYSTAPSRPKRDPDWPPAKVRRTWQVGSEPPDPRRALPRLNLRDFTDQPACEIEPMRTIVNDPFVYNPWTATIRPSAGEDAFVRLDVAQGENRRV